MRRFVELAPGVSLALHIDRKGSGLARNVGVQKASGKLLAFTDDDCYLDEDYHHKLLRDFDTAKFHYGMGQVLLHNADDDPGVAIKIIEKKEIIKPRQVLFAGMIFSANMFMLRGVFNRVGGFKNHMGAGTPFACEDIELATRCSLAGYTGIMLPSVKVYHDHGRKIDSEESAAAMLRYDLGRGAYYASLMAGGNFTPWKFWLERAANMGKLPKVLRRLQREFRGAADYLEDYLARMEKREASSQSRKR